MASLGNMIYGTTIMAVPCAERSQCLLDFANLTHTQIKVIQLLSAGHSHLEVWHVTVVCVDTTRSPRVIHNDSWYGSLFLLH